MTVQVASLVSAALQMRPTVPGHPGAGGQCRRGSNSPPGTQASPLPDYNQVPKPCPSPCSKALLTGDCRYLSTECQNLSPAQTECLQTRPLPTPSPVRARHTQEFTLLFKLPPSRTDSGSRKGSQSQEQQLLRRGPFAVLQFLLLKH